MNDFILAECAIRQLHARFVDAAWRQDADAYAELFTEDGEWKLAAMHMRGRDEIRATFKKLLGYTARAMIILGPPLLEVEQATASSRTPCTELTKMPDGSSSLAIGFYHDRYVKQEDRWLFRWRHFSLHYRGPMDLSDELVASPDYGPFPGMPDWDEPTLTRLKA